MLEEKIQKDIIEATKERNADRMSAVKAIKNEIQVYKTSGANKEVTDAVVLNLIQKLVKQHKESAEIFTQNGRQELADKELAENKYLEEYLPKQLTEEEITERVKTIITNLGAATIKDMGKVMGVANKEMAGIASGQVISKIVKELLQ